MKEITENFLRDLELILGYNDEYFIRYNPDVNEILCCLSGDKVEIYDMSDPKDTEIFKNTLLKFVKKQRTLNIKK